MSTEQVSQTAPGVLPSPGYADPFRGAAVECWAGVLGARGHSAAAFGCLLKLKRVSRVRGGEVLEDARGEVVEHFGGGYVAGVAPVDLPCALGR